MTTEISKNRSEASTQLDRVRFLDLYRTMLTSRLIDEAEQELIGRGEAFFHVSGAGHEGVALVARHLGPARLDSPHYRDKALLLARGVPPSAFLDSLLCNARSHSAGRQMSAHMSAPELRVLSTVGPVGNNALQSVGVAAEVRNDAGQPLVFCSVGDGTTQQGEFLEAIGEAVRSQLPVLFWIEDNAFAISTRTAGCTFFDRPDGRPESFYGLPIHRLDGSDVVASDAATREIISDIRSTRRPAIVVFRVGRLCNHTNADDQRVYRTGPEIEASKEIGDPITNLEAWLRESGVRCEELELARQEAQEIVTEATESALSVGNPVATLSAKRPLPRALEFGENEYTGGDDKRRLTMLEAMRSVLDDWLSRDSRVTVFGEDVEDPKGDVFGLTRGLSTTYPGRVINAPLSESTILGAAIGRGLAGGRPVACVQFADFLPLAWNQLLSELGSMYWRTVGGWQSPVIVMAACGGYRPGLGPFHAHTLESSVAHIPGIDVFMPSSAGDAAGMLNAAFRSKRPTLFLYPKVCLNDPDSSTSPDVRDQIVPVGRARRLSRGDDLTIVTWGSTVGLCENAVKTLQESGASIDLIDLRSISPWDRDTVFDSVRRTRRLLTVHEDNLTCGVGAEVVAATVEEVDGAIECRRLARADTFVPCNYVNQLAVLPSRRRILETAAEMVGREVTWTSAAAKDHRADAVTLVRAQGSSPADQRVTVVAWNIAIGDDIEVGQTVGEGEADKAVFDITAPVTGSVEEILVDEGETVRVGEGLLRVCERRTEEVRVSRTAVDDGVPRLHVRTQPAVAASLRRSLDVAISPTYCAVGSDNLDNDAIAERFAARTPEDIVRRTGIRSRHRLAAGECVLDLAIQSAQRALESEGVSIGEIGSIVCSTTTPIDASPSMACKLLHSLSNGTAREIPAHDISAACSGYLYALASGYDYIQAHPDQSVLVVTAEALSTVVDQDDFDTAILFGDAASATILRGGDAGTPGRRLLRRPRLSAKGENGDVLRVPNPGTGSVRMAGTKVFNEAVRRMSAMLSQACDDAGIDVEQLDWIVPHQANGRIIEAMRSRLPVEPSKVVNSIELAGNTSSSSIPLGLRHIEDRIQPGQRVGLCAFGGGFTFGAAVISG